MSAGSLNIADLLFLLCQHVGIVVMTLDRESEVPGSNPCDFKNFFLFFFFFFFYVIFSMNLIIFEILGKEEYFFSLENEKKKKKNFGSSGN